LTEVIGREAMTIHRLLGYNPGGVWRQNGTDENGDPKYVHHQSAVWGHDAHHQLPGGVVIVDEASMIDSELWYHLLRACGSNVSVVAIGDPNQLPPVGAGSLLRDVIQLDLAPVARLGHCHRQAGTLKANCNAILEGRIEPSVDGDPSPWMVHRNLNDPAHITKAVVKLFEVYLPQWGYDPVSDTQFLTARHAGALGTTHLNKVCQYLRQNALGVELEEPQVGGEARAVLYEGDKVMQTRNNYTLGVMNGTQGVVVETRPNLVVKFDDKEVQYTSEFKSEVSLAYVITPHKAQGSEWPCAVVICPKQHAFMQTRSWIYTACTRAKKTCVIIGDEDGVRRSAEKVEVDKRSTLLQVFAKNPEARP
jgi:exodeoxyribonuclease V alpha subunit